MRYVAAYLLASLGGNKSPSESDISKILGSVGIEVDSEKVKKVISELKGKSIEDVISKGSEKLASVPSGGGAVAAGPAAAADVAPAAVEEKKGGGKKEAKKQESESEDEDMGFGLFD